MSRLNESGVLPPNVLSPALSSELIDLSYHEYALITGELLLKLSEVVIREEVANLENYPAM